jgi:hypothetical protein
MLKSKEQLVKELGEHYGFDYFFRMNNNQFFIFKWRKKDNIANLTTWNNKCFYEWRTQQSDWKSTNGLVLLPIIHDEVLNAFFLSSLLS